MSEHPPYYGKVINRDGEQEYMQELLKKYRSEPVSEELRCKIYDEFMWEKHLGNITIPFQVVMQKDESGKGVNYIDIILEPKV